MIARPHGPDLRVRGPWPIPCRANMFASCKKHLSNDSCASLVLLGTKWACICAEKKKVLGGVVSLCRVCLCVVLSDVLCCHYCRGCAVGCVSVGVDALDVVR